MKQTPSARAVFGICATALLLSTALAVPNAYPEAYIGGQIGMTLAGNKLSSIEMTDFTPSGSMSDRSLSTSPLLGFKIGYYFPRARWFGLETEAYHMTPHIKQQPVTIAVQTGGGTVLSGFGPVTGGTTTGVLSGDNFRVITWVPVNFMFRYYKTRLQPYFGFGPGVFLARVTSTNPQFAGSQNSARLGLNAKAGAEYFFSRHVTAFAEVKYNYTSFNFASNTNGAFAFKTTYSPLLLAFGISYHF